MGIIKDFSNTSSSLRLAMCLLVVIIICLITWQGVRNDRDADKLESLTKEKQSLEAKLEDTKKARASAEALASFYLKKYREKETEVIIQENITERDNEKNVISRLPLNSTVRNLSEWVND